MDTIVQFFDAHQVLCTLAGGYIWSAFISALPAPTAVSGPLYRFWFTFFNVLAANISRAQSTRVESSPNFVPAVNAQLEKAGVAKVVVPVDSKEGDKV